MDWINTPLGRKIFRPNEFLRSSFSSVIDLLLILTSAVVEAHIIVSEISEASHSEPCDKAYASDKNDIFYYNFEFHLSDFSEVSVNNSVIVSAVVVRLRSSTAHISEL